MRRARERAAAADVVLWVVDAGAVGESSGQHHLGSGVSEVWLVENKIDLIGKRHRQGIAH